VGDGIEILWPKQSCPTGRTQWRNYTQDRDKTRFFSHSYHPATGEGRCEVEWNFDGFLYSTRWRPAASGRYSRRRCVSDCYEDTPNAGTGSRSRKKQRKLTDIYGASGDQEDQEVLVDQQGQHQEVGIQEDGKENIATGTDARSRFQRLDTSSATYASMLQIAASAALGAIQAIEGVGASDAALVAEGATGNGVAIETEESGADTPDTWTPEEDRGNLTEPTASNGEGDREGTDLPPIPRITDTPRRISHEAGEIAPRTSAEAITAAANSHHTDEDGSVTSASDDDETMHDDFTEMIAAKYFNVPATTVAATTGTSKTAQRTATLSPTMRSPAKSGDLRCNMAGRTSSIAHSKSVAALAQKKGRRKACGQHTKHLRHVSLTNADKNHDSEDQRLCEEIRTIIAENRDLWEQCKRSMPRKKKCTHPKYIRTGHTGDNEEDEDDDEESKAFMSFERTYSQAKVVCKDDNTSFLSVEQSRPISIMVRGLAKRIPSKFDDFFSAKEETGEGFILDYKICRSIWRLVGDDERSGYLKAFRDHLSSINQSLTETTRWLQEPTEWNKFVLGMVEQYAVSEYSPGGNGRAISEAGVAKLEQALKERKPDELEEVMNWEYDLT